MSKIKSAVAILAATTVTGGALMATVMTAAHATPTTDGTKKVFVCKYVKTPSNSEVLKDGKNAISVSINTIPGYKEGQSVDVGSLFTDGQELSYVVAFDNGQTAPDCTPTLPTPSQSPSASTTPSTSPSGSTTPSGTSSARPSGPIPHPTSSTPGLAATGGHS